MKKNENAKCLKFVFSTAACFALLFAALVASAASGVSAAPIAAETTAAALPASAPANIEPAGSYGADGANLDEKMKEALTAVKKVIDIDEKIYPNFNYYYYPDASGNETWNFNWYSTDGSANVNATVLGNGRILYYGRYEYNEKTPAKQVRFAELTKAEAEKKAEEFLKKMLGGEFDGYRLYYESLSYPSDRYNLVYMLAKNGYDYPEYQLYAEVDKITGEILSFSNYNYAYLAPEAPEIEYQNVSSPISQEEALNAYLENIGVELVYASYYNYETKENKIQPVYRLKNKYGEYISAADGSVVDASASPGFAPIYAYGGRGAGVSMDSNKAQSLNAEEGEAYFSEAELLELAKARNYITADEALDIVAKAFDLDMEHLKDFSKNTSLQGDYMDPEKYHWNISLYSNSETRYESYYATVNAKTGTVLSYSGNSYSVYDSAKSEEAEGVYTYEQAKEIVMKKIKELCPVDVDANFGFADQDQGDGAYYYYFNFPRTVNGITFESNGIYVTFDNISGKITGYSFQWFDKAVFPKLDKLVSPEKALESIAGFAGYDICYVSNGMTENGKINALLVYRFGYEMAVDAFTGKCVGWNFEEAEPPAEEPDYKDLEGHWGESTVWTLTNNGIYVWGGTIFDPDAVITKGELIGYLRFFMYNSYYFTQTESSIFVNQFAYRLMETYGADADFDKAITKQEAAKIICEIAGYGELGQHTEIFSYPFNDDNCDDEYKGYVAIIKAFGLILGDEGGNYDGTKELTRAEAAAIIYNIVMTFSK
ncbi:MAG: S-layer homology domain-containing protein [Oscillospiraceae bacterium]|nr:S-layer homology domain-containing protein [Oscillospiraceae bacterium]